MRVQLIGEVTVDTYVTIDIADVIEELRQRGASADEEHWRQAISVLDPCTKLLAGVPDSALDRLPKDSLETLNKRLLTESARVMRAINRKG